MSNKKQPQRKPEFPNRLCRAVGHDWQTTTIEDYRVCQREGCHATQRHVNGRWENALHRTIGWIDAREAEQQLTVERYLPTEHSGHPGRDAPDRWYSA